MKVSVIMPAYNSEKYISEAIRNVISQTFKDWELVIVDDCSTDKTLEEISEFTHDDRLKVLHNKRNLGTARSRNLAINESEGDYLAFLDSDDYWAPDKLNRQVVIMETLPVDVIHTGAITVADAQTLKWIKEKRGFNNLDYWDDLWNNSKVDDYFKMLSYGDSICWSSVMVNYLNASIVRYFDEGLLNQNEDWTFLLKLSLFSKFHFIPDKLTYYRIHKQAYTASAFIDERSWSSDIAIGQARDRCMIFARRFGRKLSYQDFSTSRSTKGKIKGKVIKYSKRITRFTRAKLADTYHLNKYRLVKNSNSDLDLMILFVTSRCNLRCLSCFFKDKLNSHDDMSFGKIKTISETMGKVNNVLLTGGEPFLRKDIGNVIELFLARSNVWINTNGYMSRTITKVLDDVLSRGFNHSIMISVSIDGFEKIHNGMRKNKKSHRKALDAVRFLLHLREKYKGLSVMINTLVSQYNADDLVEFATEISEGFDVDYHNFEIVRSDPSFVNWVMENSKQLNDIYKSLLQIIKKRYPSYWMLNKFKFKFQLNKLLFAKVWPFDCLAGDNTFVIYPSGKLSVCELRSSIIDLKDFSYNIRDAFGSKAMQEEIAKVGESKCSCTHGCWLTSSMIDYFDKHGWRLT